MAIIILVDSQFNHSVYWIMLAPVGKVTGELEAVGRAWGTLLVITVHVPVCQVEYISVLKE